MRKTEMPFASVCTAFPILEVSVASNRYSEGAAAADVIVGSVADVITVVVVSIVDVVVGCC